MPRPRIGITKPESGNNFAYMAIVTAVIACGGHPVKLTTGMSWRETEVDGLIIGGGADVFPPHYDQEAVEGASYDRCRDEMEMYWARKTRDNDLPTLAICRGAQVMNVASGGTLHQSLDKIYADVDYPSTIPGQVFYRKTIKIEETSLLSNILGRSSARVNSIHKQAISRVGAGLKVTAYEKNGVVQAIEDPARRFYLGVQFHPEFLTYHRHFKAIFKRLVETARLQRVHGVEAVV